MACRVVIADDEGVVRTSLRGILQSAGYEVVAEAADGIDAVECCRELKPDLLLLDCHMPLLNGIQVAKIVLEKSYAKFIVMVTVEDTLEVVEAAAAVGVLGYLLKPVVEKSLLSTITIARCQAERFALLKQEKNQSQRRLEERIVIERAKGFLMEQRDLSEDEAFSMIRKLGMDKRRSMGEIAEIILLDQQAIS